MDDITESIHLDHPLSNTRDIRVLDITSSLYEFQSPVQCTLRVISIDNPLEKYQALSYAWGSAARTHTILCDGKSFRVTQNLDEALRRIREKIFLQDVFSSTIWIDDICINQDDNSEKSKQVAMMGDIYHRSSRLVIWLGEASKLEINSIQAAIGNPRDATSPAILQGLTSRPWFERLWVVQEVFRSRRACRHFLLGDFRCIFDRIIMSCTAANVLASSTAFLREWLPIARDPSPAWINDPTQRKSLSLVVNMMRFRQAKASVLHDRVFALLSISAPGTEVPVDYEADFRAVCIDIASNHATSREPLIFLLMCATTLRLEHGTAIDLPSWVPDWRSTAAILESDPRRLQNLESNVNEAFQQKDANQVKKIEQNVLITVAYVFESKVLGENKPLYTCGRCHGINIAACNTGKFVGKGWVRDVHCGKLVVFSLAEDINVLFIASVTERGQRDDLHVVLESYCMRPAHNTKMHLWLAHYRAKWRWIYIH